MYPRLLQIGALAIPTYGVAVAIAVMAALFLSQGIARRHGLDSERVWDLGIVGVLVLLLAPRFILVASNWRDFVAHPLWMLSVLTVRSAVAQVGGLALAGLAMLLYAKFAGLPVRRTLDALAPGLALAVGISDVGAFLAGSEFGTRSSLPWAVVYTKRLASLWYGTPLGIALHPVQAYEALIQLGSLLILLAIIFRRDFPVSVALRTTRGGELMGSWLFLTGFATFFLDYLRGDLVLAPLPSTQYMAACMVVVGGVLWL